MAVARLGQDIETRHIDLAGIRAYSAPAMQRGGVELPALDRLAAGAGNSWP